MSDFVFTARRTEPGLLASYLAKIYRDEVPQIFEFHGNWGSLAVSKNLHMGFDPVETETHICVVIGGPVLSFASNRFLAGEDPVIGTRLLLRKWVSGEAVQWDEDLNGPFVALKVDLKQMRLEIITDLVSCIPVYQANAGSAMVIGTHIDVVVQTAGCARSTDPVSIADFVLHDVITYPYTIYHAIKQISPASRHCWMLGGNEGYQKEEYWLPRQTNHYDSLNAAADDLRQGLKAYVDRVVEGLDRVALFISGGEDSRTVLGMLPRGCDRSAFIFLDHMNREGRVAQAAAHAYAAKFTMLVRDQLWYFNKLPACSDLVGAGAQFKHVHSYEFHKHARLSQYRAVFGGHLSDGFLKGYFIKRRGEFSRFPFLPFRKAHDQSNRNLHEVPFLDHDVLAELRTRTDAHLELLQTIRGSESAHEWFNLWPLSMDFAMPHYYGNRRLFASYEPFLSTKSIKVGAAVPQSWKLNRKLFQKMAQPMLEPSKYLVHADGWMPYFPWYVNVLAHGSVWLWRGVENRLGLVKGNQGPWNDWDVILESKEWRTTVDGYIEVTRCHEGIFNVSLKDLFEGSYLTTTQKVNLMQIIYQSLKPT